MEVFCVLPSVSLGEGVNLDPEWDALLSAVLPGSELCADAVHLKVSAEAIGVFRNDGSDEQSKWKSCKGKCVCFRAASGAARSTKRSLCGIPAQRQKFFSSCPTGTLPR